jgi:hypothetical protein
VVETLFWRGDISPKGRDAIGTFGTFGCGAGEPGFGSLAARASSKSVRSRWLGHGSGPAQM